MARFSRTLPGFRRPRRRLSTAPLSKGGGAVAYAVTLSAATYTVTASSLSAQTGRPLTLSATTYTVAAASLTALTRRFAVLSPASYVLTASNLGASVGRPATLSAASYSLSASSLTALLTRDVTLSPASFTVTGASLGAVYTPGAGAVNYTTTLNAAVYAFTGASLTATASVTPSVTVPVGGGGGPSNLFYRGRRRFEVRKAIDRALRELTETKTTRSRKRKARRVAREIVAQFDIDILALQLPPSVPEQFLPLEQARQAAFEFAAKLKEQEDASAENARKLQELFAQYQAEAKRLEQREEEEAMAIILAVAA